MLSPFSKVPCRENLLVGVPAEGGPVAGWRGVAGGVPVGSSESFGGGALITACSSSDFVVSIHCFLSSSHTICVQGKGI